MKKHFALIGHPLFHSISPFIHNRLFEISKISAEYKLLDIDECNLLSSMLFLNKLDGYNITIPYKQSIIPFINKLYGKAEIYRCVNTIKNNKFSFGYNTDADGFLYALKLENLNLSGNITILGCGGVARIFCFESVLHGCNVTLAVRKQSLNRAKSLVCDIKNITRKTVEITSFNCLPKNIDLLINATPIGMFPHHTEQIPVSDANLKKCKAVFDAIYNPINTLLMKKALSNGSKVASGLSMLVYQAVLAHKIWNESIFSDADIHQLIIDSKETLKNFV